MTFLFVSLETRIAGVLIELQSLLVNRSVLSKVQLLAADVNQWSSILSQSNLDNGKFRVKDFTLYRGTAETYNIVINNQPRRQLLCYVFVKYFSSRKVSPSCG